MINLCSPVQTYAWGKAGSFSEVASLKAAVDKEFQPDEGTAYAELWMGTHSNGPSVIEETGDHLSKWLHAHPAAMGPKLASKLQALGKSNADSGVQLPFLLKVLSVNKALSIQVHPTKDQAVVLHSASPGNYPDDNHKPEMAIALSPFELLCGFRPPQEILQHLKETPELFELVGGPGYQMLAKAMEDKNPVAEKEGLKTCFSNLMNQPAALVQKNITSLTERIGLALNQQQPGEAGYVMGELIVRLHYHYPGDVGCFAPFFLNHFLLQPGEACFLGPNEPHAYLYGDCVECMACSDNTIRAGLTPKFKDIPTLIESLTYRMSPATDNKFPSSPHPTNPCVAVYAPPVPEFVVHKLEIETGEFDLDSINTCSLIIVTSGEAKDSNGFRLTRGSTVLVAADQSAKFAVSEGPFRAFRAFCDPSKSDQL